jgi:hypothetical protein
MNHTKQQEELRAFPRSNAFDFLLVPQQHKPLDRKKIYNNPQKYIILDNYL